MVSTNKIKLSIEKVKDIQEFVNIANTLPCGATLGRHIDACSILGVLDYIMNTKSDWFYLTFEKFVGEEIIDKFKKWEVK